jgi:hypothetical protein
MKRHGVLGRLERRVGVKPVAVPIDFVTTISQVEFARQDEEEVREAVKVLAGFIAERFGGSEGD